MERTLDPARLGDHLDRLYRAAWALCGSREDAEDLVQETYARLLARPRWLRNEDDLGYLLGALRNTFLNQKRTESRRLRPGPLPDALELVADPHAVEPHAALGPTELAPDAGGTATLTKTSSGWRIVLHATGLPRLDGGRFYQGWLRNASGALVPVGTFNEGADVTLWSGVSPKQFTTLTVTRERDDGDQASSGEKVLVGTVSTGD